MLRALLDIGPSPASFTTLTVSGASTFSGLTNIGTNLKLGPQANVTTEVLNSYVTAKDASGNTIKLGVVA